MPTQKYSGEVHEAYNHGTLGPDARGRKQISLKKVFFLVINSKHAIIVIMALLTEIIVRLVSNMTPSP